VATLSEAELALREQLVTLTQRHEALAVAVGRLQERTRTLEQEAAHQRQRLHDAGHERDQLRARLAQQALQTATAPMRPLLPLVSRPTPATVTPTSRWRRVVAVFAHLDDRRCPS
jgi:hypothetical protein